jgi:butyryl-CoA dehydrogenase
MGQKDPNLPPVPIIEHADVKRMLLFQRAVIEGALALIMQCSKYVDFQKVLGREEKEKYYLLLEILTPIAKSYPSEMGIISISQGLQCLGGSGYCDDYPLEQYYRDCRIHPIHEGTTGIQGMDLLGRKVIMKNGQTFLLFINEIEDTIGAAQQYSELRGFANDLNSTLTDLQDVTQHLITIAQQQGPEAFLADATLYLDFFSTVTIAWQWLLQGVAAQKALNNGAKKKDQNFYQGKMFALRYFFAYELPKTLGQARRLMDDDQLTVEMQPEYFND